MDELKRYTKHIEIRFKDISEAEERANNKVLTLLDEVSKLTQENQSYLVSVNAERQHTHSSGVGVRVNNFTSNEFITNGFKEQEEIKYTY